MRAFARRHRKKLIALGVVIVLPFLAHFIVGVATTLPLPPGSNPEIAAVTKSNDNDGARRTSKGWTVVRGGVRLVYLAGSPEEIGAQHTALLYDRMAEDERVLWDGFEQLVPFSPIRTLMFDVSRVRHRNVAANFPDARRREIAAEARAFTPDPYADHLPTYQRMVMLHALYDIALGFEHSPLIAGCTTFAIGPDKTADGHTIFARTFDFEAAEVFDQDKAVFLVHEDGKIPFASVAWPGFIGVVTGMNAEGVAIAVHGGRARDPSTTGIPVAFSLREALSSARTAKEAIAILEKQEVMVSHLVFVADASGHSAIVERAPGVAAHVRTSSWVTNHFEGPLLATDPKNEAIVETTSTVNRAKRIDRRLKELPPKAATVTSALEMLRDHGCDVFSIACELGDRRAIDAFIATHGVVADLTDRVLWVSEGPHLAGRFIKIDPHLLLSTPLPTVNIPKTEELETLPADPMLSDGRYAEGRARAGGPLLHAVVKK